MANIDCTELSAKHTSVETKRRLRSRYWAQLRLQAYGITAIGFAALALVILMSTIVSKTTSVVYEYYVTLDAQIEVSDSERARLEDPRPEIRAQLRRSMLAALTDAVPGEVSRSESRALSGLVSTSAALELGDVVKADTGLIGQTVTFDALLDDNTQLYLKGRYGKLTEIRSSGTMTVTPVEGQQGMVQATMGVAALSEIFVALRARRSAEAVRARTEQARQQNAIDVTLERLADAQDAGDTAAVEQLEADLQRYTADRDRAQQLADALRRMATVRREVTFEMGAEDPSLLIQVGGGWIKATEVARERLVGEIYEAVDGDSFAEGTWQAFMIERPERQRPISDRQIVWLTGWQERGLIGEKLNTRLLGSSDSASAELAGIWGAVVGSFWTMVVTFALAFPLGVMASIYLEEFAPKNRLTDLIEVNINNLAAVPSIVFGILGLAVFIQFMHLPQSAPLVGGLVLTLMTLPTIIIATRASLKSVPPSIRDAALGV
ncbi:MAG: DUF3333 domain-containing protein, partial [Pseudomonadota bacterium]